MRGRRPLPTAVKRVSGTLRRDRANLLEPRPPLDVPACPTFLNAIGRAKWRELSEVLTEMRVMTKADASALAQVCDAWAFYRRNRAIIDRRGATFTVRTESGSVVRPRPEVAMMQDAWRRYWTGLADFGLTPAGRPKVHAHAQLELLDPAEKYFP